MWYNMLHKICEDRSIDEGSTRLFTVSKDDHSLSILIGRKNNILFACDNYCPHRGASLSKSQLSCENNRLICYLHDFEYNVFSGKLEKIPEKWKDQSSEWKNSRDLLIYRIFENDGSIFVDIP